MRRAFAVYPLCLEIRLAGQGIDRYPPIHGRMAALVASGVFRIRRGGQAPGVRGFGRLAKRRARVLAQAYGERGRVFTLFRDFRKRSTLIAVMSMHHGAMGYPGD